MTPEPLKRKGITEDCGCISFEEDDIKSAVEGCLEEIYTSTRGLEHSQYIHIKEIFKKWFEDVM